MAFDDEELRRLCSTDPDAVIAIIKKLEVRIAELEARQNTNSRNSNMPPSTDFFRPKSLRIRGERNVGGQKGHPGTTLRLVSVPDSVIDHRVDVCDTCGASLFDVPATGVEKRQVFDIPHPGIMVSEHRAEIKQCPCCHEYTRARFPGDVLHPVQYGNNLKALVVYLLVFQYVPYERIAMLFKDLYGHQVSRATLVGMVESCYDRLAVAEAEIHRLLVDERVVHVDETGFRANGRLQWLHVASTRLVTWYGHHGNRGMKAIRAQGILPRVTGTLVHDFWKPYQSLRCGHALCNAHLLRELEGVRENTGQLWAGRMKRLLLTIKNRVDSRREYATGLDLEEIACFESRYKKIIELGLEENRAASQPGRGKRGPGRQSRAKNLVDRCRDYQYQVLAFMHDFQVPFDNNQAERDIRMAKLQQKISGTSRSDEGAAWFCRIRSYLSTVRKNDQPVLASLTKAFQGHPYIPISAH